MLDIILILLVFLGPFSLAEICRPADLQAVLPHHLQVTALGAYLWLLR